jgi:photosynthetic reaction center H subunit
VGNPLTAGVGPGSWSDRADVPDVDYHFHPKIVPLRARPEFGVSEKDTDPRGALVYGTDGEIAGTVTELWLDTAEIAFRYFEVTLADGGRKIMLPWGFARITRQGPLEVHALQAHQFAGIPALKAPDTITILEEEKIQAYFGAGLLYAEPERADPLV